MALMAMDGGATLGYSATGKCVSATHPANMMKTEITHAKIGRSMKNLGMASLYFPAVELAVESGVPPVPVTGTGDTVMPGCAF